ncbi:MAG: hypothetical protein WA990_04335 [Rubrobacteraceae bacterium]
MRKKMAVLSMVALVSVSGLAGCGVAQDAVEQRANEEIDKGKTKVEQRVEQEKTKAIDKAKEQVENQGGG